MLITIFLVLPAAMLAAAAPYYGNPVPSSTTASPPYPILSRGTSAILTGTGTGFGTGTVPYVPVTPPSPTYSAIWSYSCDLGYCENSTSYCLYWAGVSSFDLSLMKPVPGETRTSVGPCTVTANYTANATVSAPLTGTGTGFISLPVNSTTKRVYSASATGTLYSASGTGTLYSASTTRKIYSASGTAGA